MTLQIWYYTEGRTPLLCYSRQPDLEVEHLMVAQIKEDRKQSHPRSLRGPVEKHNPPNYWLRIVLFNFRCSKGDRVCLPVHYGAMVVEVKVVIRIVFGKNTWVAEFYIPKWIKRRMRQQSPLRWTFQNLIGFDYKNIFGFKFCAISLRFLAWQAKILVIEKLRKENRMEVPSSEPYKQTLSAFFLTVNTL